MVDYMRIINEVVRADNATSKETECLALSQVAWLCMYEIYEISKNDDVAKVKDSIADLNMRCFMNGGDE